MMVLDRPSISSVVTDYQVLHDDVQYYLSHIKRPLFIDTETTGFDPFTCKLVSIQLFQEGSPTRVIDTRHLNLTALTLILKPLFESDILFVGANIKFDYGFILHHLGLRMLNLYDVMIAEQILAGVGFSGAKAIDLKLSLEGMCKRRGIDVSKEERSWFADLDGDERWHEWLSPFPAEQVEYMKQDVEVLQRIFSDQVQAIKDKKLSKVAHLEMDALPAFGEIEHNGIKVNIPEWRVFIAEQKIVAEELEEQLIEVLGPPIKEWQTEKYDREKLAYNMWAADRDEYLDRLRFWFLGHDDEPGYEMGWGKFKNERMQQWRELHPNPGNPRANNLPPNINSHDQLMIAFESLGIPAKNTSEEVLKELKDDHPIIALLLKYRKKNKFVDSFGETLLEKISEVTGRIHPSVIQIGADTGRSSVTRPNTQQWPSRGPDGKRLRSLVIPNEGNVFVVNDYPNIELRIFAYMSGCQRMLDAFARGEDLHSITPRAMFGLGADVDVKTTVACDRQGRVLNGWTYREIGKTVNFGIVYGMGVHKLARTLNTTVDEATVLMDGYYEMYPEVRTYQAKVKAQALKTGVTYTLSGRPHYYRVPQPPERTKGTGGFREDNQRFWEETREYRKTISSIERMACNYPIQGTSADITKLALGMLVRRLDLDCVKLVNIIHDELLLETTPEYAPSTAAILEEVMSESCAILMPGFPVNCSGAHIAACWEK